MTIRTSPSRGPASPEVTGFYEPDTGSIQYVVSDPGSGRAAIIDAVWNFDPAHARTATHSVDAILRHVEARGLQVDWILDTHPHADHFMAAAYLENRFGRAAYMREIERYRANYEKVRAAGKDKSLVFPDWLSPTREDRAAAMRQERSLPPRVPGITGVKHVPRKDFKTQIRPRLHPSIIWANSGRSAVRSDTSIKQWGVHRATIATGELRGVKRKFVAQISQSGQHPVVDLIDRSGIVLLAHGFGVNLA